MKKSKYHIWQYVCIKDAKLRNRYPEFTGLILGLVGSWQGTNQGYGILMEDGRMTDFREEELEPMLDPNELQCAMSRASKAIDAHGAVIMREAKQYFINPYNEQEVTRKRRTARVRLEDITSKLKQAIENTKDEN